MKLLSTAFEHEGKIPTKYTCEGQNVNPPFELIDVPEEAQSLALIMDDPDVPEWVRKERMYDHWVIFNMPPETRRINENTIPPGIQGKNTAGKSAYTGPCPPDQEHRYFFMLYALDILLDLDSRATKEDVLKAMAGHIIAKTELMGRYEMI
jgi:Raf kinase inhibitor-like YbhB/YbcL family protein